MIKSHTLFFLSIFLIITNCNKLFSQELKKENKSIIQRNNIFENNRTLSSGSRSVLTVLSNNGSADTNGRAPQGSRLYVNTCYIIRPSEMVASGFGSDTVKSVGWTWNASRSQNITTKGTLKVYILNTTDTAYNKGTNFATAISGMTKIIDDSIVIPAGLGPFSVNVPAGGPGTSSFVTTSGQGIYIAFEYKTTSSLATPSGSPTISCNNSLVNRGGTFQSQGSNGTSLLLSSYAPETKLGNSKLDSVEIKVLYCLGGIPSTFACNDTLGIRVKKNYAGAYPVTVKIRIDNISPPFNVRDSIFIPILSSGIYDTLIRYQIPCYAVSVGGIVFQRDRIIVQALSGELDDSYERFPPVTIYSTKENCHYTTYDFYNYADPCVNDNGGIGINNSSGNIVARFNNYSSNSVPVKSVEHSFTNLAGNGNNSYKIIIYGDNGSGKPGALLYSSPTLMSPAGTGFSQTVSHTLTSTVNISANSRFYVGIRQNNSTNIGFSFQNEIPVRSKSFFYSYPDTSNTWTDFSEAGADYKLDIAPVLGVVSYVNTLQEGFTSVTFPPTGWSAVFTGTNYWSRNSVSSFGIGSGSAKFNYFSAPVSTTQSLVTLTFPATDSGNYLSFDLAYAPNTSGTDSLKIETSTNSGISFSNLTSLFGNSAGGTMNTAPASGASYTPTSTQWLTKTYALPVGVNQIRFKAISGLGNNLYLDSICVFDPSITPFVLNLKLFMEGFYDTGTNTLVSDTVSLSLRNSVSPYLIAGTVKSTLNSSGNGTFLYNFLSNGTGYYIQVKHRNSIETWSSSITTFSTNVMSYDFSTSASQAYGSNMTLKGSVYAIYSGDINQDGIIDVGDLSQVENDAQIFTFGYSATDVNGDDFVDAADLAIVENNTVLGIFAVTP